MEGIDIEIRHNGPEEPQQPKPKKEAPVASASPKTPKAPKTTEATEASATTATSATSKKSEAPETSADRSNTPKDDHPSLKEVIKEQATEDEAPLSRNLSLGKILGGDILNTTFVRRQIWLFMLIALFMIIYVANRYSCQQDIIEIDRLQRELQDAKYKELSSTSQLTERSRESNVLNQLKNNKDSVLKIPSQPPYIINVPEK